MDLTGAIWRKSSRSNGSGGNCVEIANLDGGHRAVRDSKDPAGAALIVTLASWTAFTTGLRDSNFG